MINVRSIIVLAVGGDSLFPLTVAALTLLTELTRMAADTMPMAEAPIPPMEAVAAVVVAVVILEGQATLAVTLVVLIPEVTVLAVLMADQTVILAAVAAQAPTIDQRPAPTDLVMLAEMRTGPKIRTTRATLHKATVLLGLVERPIMALALRGPGGAQPIMVALELRQRGTPPGTTAPQVHATPSTADSNPILESCLALEAFTSTRYFDSCFVPASDFFGDYILMFFFTIK